MKNIQLNFTEEEMTKLQSMAEGHKMEVEAFVKAVLTETMKKTSHSK